MDAIPVVALTDQDSPNEAVRRRFGLSLKSALCEFGFVRLEDHGIDRRLIHRVYDHFETFFARNESVKLACSGVAGGQRGFTPFGVEHARDHPHPDLKEFFHIGQIAPGAADYPGNLWPGDMSGMERDGVRLFRSLEACAIRILEALALAFGLPREVFAGLVVGGNSILRAVHYPPLPSGRDPASVRAAAHEDINLITLLCEATDAGLEIRPPGAGGWIPVEVQPGQIVVDSGDMLSRMTNDVVPATTHRVVTPPGSDARHRYSLPFFAHPRPECDLSVIRRFVTPERPARHAPITAGAYLAERLRDIGLVS
jgi:isopenicillin N synthase-like dioxygenase